MQRQLWTITLLLPLLTSGCATNALWNKTQLDAWNEPASNANVHLFDASQRKDFLVVYDEYSERHDSIHTRAYFLNQNQGRAVQGQKPHFVSARASRKLPPVPIFQTLPESSTNFSQTICAVISTNGQFFTIYSGKEKTDYNLPVYNDGQGQIDRIALTPIAVVADATIAGGVLAVLCWYELGTSDYSVSVH